MDRSKGLQEVKGFRKSFIILSVFYVIAGVVLLFWPAMSIEMFCRVLGIGTLIVGLAHVIIYFTKDHMMNIMEMDLVIGVVCAAFGSFLLLHPEFVQAVLPFAVGILLLVGAIVKLQNAIDMKRLKFKNWKVMLIFALILLILGGILIYTPFSGHSLLIYIGASLILDGVVNITGMLCISHRVKKLSKAGTAGTAEASVVHEQIGRAQDAEVVDVPSVREDKQELETQK